MQIKSLGEKAVGKSPIKDEYIEKYLAEKNLDLMVTPDAIMVAKSIISVGYTACIREKTGSKNIIFSLEFLHEFKSLYDNVYRAKSVAV